MHFEPPPPVLYKFMPASYDGGRTILRLLDNGLIRFTQRQGLNDPFEIEGAFYNASDNVELLKRYRQEAFARMRRQRTNGKRSKISFGRMVKAFQAIERHNADGTSPLAEETAKHSRERWDDYGILSLTANFASSAMWSHYANRHTGVCVGFDSSMKLFHRNLDVGFLPLREVKYGKERVRISLTDQRQSVTPGDIFFRKSEHWSYEEEWRVVAKLSLLPKFAARKEGMTQSVPVYLFPLELNSVREILVGALAAPEVEKKAVDFAKRAKQEVRVYRMNLHETEFTMKRELVAF